jgi:hypothetical protein
LLLPGAGDLRARAGRLSEARMLEREMATPEVEELELVSTSGLTARCAVKPAGGGALDMRSHIRDLETRFSGGDSETQSRRGGLESRSRIRYPAFVIVGGYESGRRAVTFPRFPGVVFLACDYPFELPERLNGAVFLKTLPALNRTLVDFSASLLLAVDYLSSRPDVDPASLAVVGASVGVPFATVATALDARVRGAALLYGGGDLPRLFAHNIDLESQAANWLARQAIAVLSRSVEPTRYAGAISPRPVLAVNARDDPFIPLESALALHRSLREPKEIRWLSLDHFEAFHEGDLLAQLTELTAGWFQQQGIRLSPK